MPGVLQGGFRAFYKVDIMVIMSKTPNNHNQMKRIIADALTGADVMGKILLKSLRELKKLTGVCVKPQYVVHNAHNGRNM